MAWTGIAETYKKLAAWLDGGATVSTTPAVGGATEAEQQTQTTHLSQIEAAVEILYDIVSGSEAQVDVVTSALPTGASTLAEQQTQTTHLSEIEGAVETLESEANTGYSIFRSIDLDETEEEVKATAGRVFGVWVSNTATTTRFLKFYNATAATVVVGTTAPVLTIAIPGNTSDDVTGNLGPGGAGIAFATAITVAATTGVLDADTGAPGANEVLCNIFFK